MLNSKLELYLLKNKDFYLFYSDELQENYLNFHEVILEKSIFACISFGYE